MKTKYVFLSHFAFCLLLIHFISPLAKYALPIALGILLLMLIRFRKQLPDLPLFYFLAACVLLAQRFTKKDTYILFDNLYEANAECIDTYCIFQYMQQHHIPSYYVVWKENYAYEKIKDNPHVITVNTSIKTRNSFEFFYKIFRFLPRTKAVITSFGNVHHNPLVGDFLYKNPYFQYVHTSHGPTLLKTAVLSTGYFSPYKYNKVVVTNLIERSLFMAYGWKRKNLPVIGFARWDRLKRIPHPQKTIFVMFTWRHSFARWNARKFSTPLQQTRYYQGIMNLLNSPKLQNLLRKHNVKLRYTLHHSLLNQCTQPDQMSFPNLEYVPCENISRHIGQSDLFITDYSSLFFDFAFLNIPVIFYRPDWQDETLVPSDREDIKHAMSMDELLFNACYDTDSAIRTIEKYIQNDFTLEPENVKKLDKFFTYRSGITAKLVDYLRTL